MGNSTTVESRSPTAARRTARHEENSAKTCDLCGSQDFETIAEHDRRGRDLATAICQRCGLVVHLNVPSDAELAEFYATNYRREYNGENTPSSRRLVRAWNNGLRIYRQLEKVVRRGDHVFEIGAGLGATVKVFEQRGCLATGIEPFDGFRDYGRDKLGASLGGGDLSRLPKIDPQDLVLLVHVIEHLNAPTESLQKIRALLKPHGRLYVECPNLAAPFARRSQLFHFAHIYNFTPDTLAMLAEKCGFEVEAVYSAAHDPNLRMLLRRTDAAKLELRAESYAHTMEALRRYNAWTYHLRASYLAPRCQKLLGYANEQLFAWRDARRIITRCQSAARLRQG